MNNQILDDLEELNRLPKTPKEPKKRTGNEEIFRLKIQLLVFFIIAIVLFYIDKFLPTVYLDYINSNVSLFCLLNLLIVYIIIILVSLSKSWKKRLDIMEWESSYFSFPFKSIVARKLYILPVFYLYLLVFIPIINAAALAVMFIVFVASFILLDRMDLLESVLFSLDLWFFINLIFIMLLYYYHGYMPYPKHFLKVMQKQY